MTISDERLADARARFIGAKLRVDDEGMVEVPLDYLDEAVLAFEEVQQSRTTADTEQDGKGVKDLDADLPTADDVRGILSTLSNAPWQEAVPQIYRWREKGSAKWRYSDVTPDDDDRRWNDIEEMQPLYASPLPVDPAPSQDGVVTETQETIGLWADEVFGKVTDLPRAVRRADEEMAELLEEASGDANPGRMAKEMADVVIVLMRIAHVIGIDLAATINAKMAINRGRKWRADGTGHGYHIKDTALEAALNKGGE